MHAGWLRLRPSCGGLRAARARKPVGDVGPSFAGQRHIRICAAAAICMDVRCNDFVPLPDVPLSNPLLTMVGARGSLGPPSWAALEGRLHSSTWHVYFFMHQLYSFK